MKQEPKILNRQICITKEYFYNLQKLASSGQVIQAIQHLRIDYSLGLREAKDIYDEIRSENKKPKTYRIVMKDTIFYDAINLQKIEKKWLVKHFTYEQELLKFINNKDIKQFKLVNTGNTIAVYYEAERELE